MPNQKSYIQQSIKTNVPYFVGFNTINQSSPPYSLTNIDIVKRDILNQFATPLGSRVMLPNFGTRIFEMLFDPFDEFTKNAIIEDAVRVVQSDPRVSLQQINVFQQDQTLNVIMMLNFIPEAITDSLFATFSLNDQQTF